MKKFWFLIAGTCLFVACDSAPTAPANKPATGGGEKTGKVENKTTTSNDADSAKAKSDVAANPDGKPFQPDSKPAEPKTFGERFAAAKAEFDTFIADISARMGKAKPEERQAIMQERQSKTGDFCKQIMDLVSESPDAAEVPEALAWVVSRTTDEKMRSSITDQLFEKFIDRDVIKDIIPTLGRGRPDPTVETKFATVLEKSPHDAVKALATFSFASYLQNKASLKETLENNPEAADQITKAYGEEVVKYVKESNDKDKVIQLLDDLVTKYPTAVDARGTKYSDRASGMLFELKNLQIGMSVPEIEGKDLDDVAFKLSDYRGKVVVVDFWGDW